MQPTCFPHIPTARPTARLVADARHVVANPEHYADRTTLRRLAWAVLMAARGRAVDQNCLAAMPTDRACAARAEDASFPPPN